MKYLLKKYLIRPRLTTGYCSDYCAKNQPMAFHEIREFQKGHCQLHKDILQRGDSLDKVGKKRAMRIMSDAYLKEIVRGQVECCNLRANYLEACPVAVERVSSSSLISFPGATFLNMVRRLANKDDNVPKPLHGVSKAYSYVPLIEPQHTSTALHILASGNFPLTSLSCTGIYIQQNTLIQTGLDRKTT